MATNEEMQDLKEKGNQCVKSGNFTEAVFHYSYAIKLDPRNHTLYSNRSLCFLKMQQYYFALEDASEAIKLQPQWPKGYFRKGEVQAATFHFSDAIDSYYLALNLQGGEDPVIEEAIRKTKQEMKKDQRGDVQIPWLAAGMGIIIGVTIVIGDHVVTVSPSMPNPIAKTLFTMLIAVLGYGVGSLYRYYIKYQRTTLLEPPVDLLGGDDKEDSEDSNHEKENSTPTKTRPREKMERSKGQPRRVSKRRS